MRTVRIILIVLTAIAPVCADQREFFESKIRPLLAEKCFACHTASRMGGLEMKSRQALLKGGKDGPAIVPDKPEESLLIKAVSYTDERLKMPPAGKLPADEVEALTLWVKTGAWWPEESPSAVPQSGGYTITPEQRRYWAFQPIRQPAAPKVKDTSWLKGPIDSFILAQLEARGLQPVRLADKRTLIRRATADLTGLPPTPEEVDAFLTDTSAGAFGKVIDRLLASPRYGERWGRYWLDVARYSDDKFASVTDAPYPNAFRYRDWVIKAFNDDMPFDVFVKAQIAGDLIDPQNARNLVAGAGFFSLSPEFQEDRVDAATRGFLGLTVACAQCHNHKYDPIPTRDYYSLLGIFESTETAEFPLAPAAVVASYKKQKQQLDEQQDALKTFLTGQTLSLEEVLAGQTSNYLVAACKVQHKAPAEEVAAQAKLDRETLERWAAYLKRSPKQQAYFNKFDGLCRGEAGEADLKKAADEIQPLVLKVLREQRKIEEKNKIITGGATDETALAKFQTLSLPRDQFVLWKELFSPPRRGALQMETSVLYYGDKDVERFLPPLWKAHVDAMRAGVESFKAAMPPAYPFLQVLRDSDKPHNIRVHIRGNPDNLGEEAPRAFLSILNPAEPVPFRQGSGRLELAEAIASPQNPLTARVMVNRIWQHHFGAGIVRTPSNFGQLGDRPSHPALLDYLASRFIGHRWSVKAMHREIMLSAAYQLSTENSAANYAVDPDNRLVWHAARQRMDVEALRDSLLAVAGTLDTAAGGPPVKLTEESNNRRTVYGFVSRRKLDDLLALFDFPNPNMTSEQRIPTNVPLQQLFFLNSDMILRSAETMARRIAKEAGPEEKAEIGRAYRLLFARAPKPQEEELALNFLRQEGSLAQYLQVLMSSNEFVFVN